MNPAVVTPRPVVLTHVNGTTEHLIGVYPNLSQMFVFALPDIRLETTSWNALTSLHRVVADHHGATLLCINHSPRRLFTLDSIELSQAPEVIAAWPALH